MTGLLSALIPILLGILSQNLPKIVTYFLDKWLSYKPKTAIDNALTKLDEAIAEGDLTELGRINTVISDMSPDNALSLEQLRAMERLINE